MESIRQVARNLIEKQDYRTKDLPLVTNPFFVFGSIFGYLYIVRNGERWMKNREPFQLKQTIRAYNVFMMLANAYFLRIGLANTYFGGGYSFFCQGIYGRNDENFLWAISVGWWYLLVRYLDFLDTFFFILRKKFTHVSRLHVIHHTIVAFNGSFWYLYAPEGQPAAGLFVNAFIHVLMYGYYFLATFPAMRPYLWWKKHLTMLQIGQFIFFIAHMSIPLFYDCEFPHYLVHFAIAQTILILSLFINFYIKAYVTQEQNNKRHPRVKLDVNGNVYELDNQVCSEKME
ncbi:elongation of very long chain fatty acids protein 4-like isoform X1 [Varroa jacobsoni]|uniref:Elongation of very long chain fatty acids protein n=1 Tax=Varroa destructor TaxID=109461 RepID=A0A7M7MC56_VARDE|nr:elongation of very long chain fatty acids protein 4-like isoform X1 [Varroa destructor]XP_022709395.1 elongation of very long chain fatty acids protein 4-like isoform X1 [Varroa jacobsoni]